MTTDLAVEAAGLTKAHGAVRVLRGVDLTVQRGTVFGLLGPNGAGKTTTVRILCTLSRPDTGRARVAGLDVVADRRAVRSRISLTSQYAAVDAGQTGMETLRMMGRLAGLSAQQSRQRATELLRQFDLTDAGRRPAGTYSGGMRRRLDLAASLVSRPHVLFLDEPTTGLDLRGRQAMWQVITELASSGVTIFLTTQYLEEADLLADRVAVLHGGQIVADDTPQELKRRVGGQRLDLELADGQSFDAVSLKLAHRAVRHDRTDLIIGVPTDGSASQVRGLLDELDPHDCLVRRLAVHAASLDEVFLALTGHPASSGETSDDSATSQSATRMQKETTCA